MQIVSNGDRKQDLTFMQIVSSGDNLHKMLNPFSRKIKKNILISSLVKILPRVLSIKLPVEQGQSLVLNKCIAAFARSIGTDRPKQTCKPRSSVFEQSI